MANAANESVVYPFTGFNFEVAIHLNGVDGISGDVCNAAFAECDGLDMTMDVKTIREGGNNTQQVRLTGAVNYGTLTLKRGMTANFDLWKWFGTLYEPNKGGLRGTATVVILSPDRTARRAEFALTGCLPVKLKAPALNAKESAVAIEEFQMAYETLQLVPQS